MPSRIGATRPAWCPPIFRTSFVQTGKPPTPVVLDCIPPAFRTFVPPAVKSVCRRFLREGDFFHSFRAREQEL